MITVKVRSSDGEEHTLEIAEDGDALFFLVAESLGLERGEFVLLHGFPPRPLDSNGDQTARQLGVKNNDRLIIRLNNEETGVQQAKQRAPRRRPKKAMAPAEDVKKVGDNKTEVADKLVAAFQGGPRDAVSSFLRKAGRQGVAQQESIRQANDRYQAALAKTFKFIRKGGQVIGGALYTVEYPKGKRAKHMDEEVKVMDSAALKATIEYVLAVEDPEQLVRVRESMRPHKMAEVAKSAFWSLVQYCQQKGHLNLEDGLCELAPSIDWSFLESRLREKSEKAKAVEAQAKRLQEAKEERAREALERKRKREAAPTPAQRQAEKKRQLQLIRNKQREEKARLLALVGGSRKAGAALTKQGVKTVVDLASMEPGQFSQTVSDFVDSVDDCLHDARVAANAALFADIVGEDLVETLVEKQVAASTYDLVRLRVPGRVDFVASDLGLEKEVVTSWQEQAAQLVEKRPWLKEFRNIG